MRAELSCFKSSSQQSPGVLVAISIQIFTAQLEKAREATDLANVRAAYAELSAEYLTAGTDATATVPEAKKVKVTQKQENWQCDGNKTETEIASSVKVPAKASGEYTVSITNGGVITVS